MPPLLLSEIFSELMLSFEIREILDLQRDKIRQRNAFAAKALGDCILHRNDHSLNVWISLPDHWTPESFVQVARDENILVKPSQAFTPIAGSAPNAVRISMGSSISDQQFENALETICGLMELESVATIS